MTAKTKQPLHDSPDWTWAGGDPKDPMRQPDDWMEATYVGEVAGGERDYTGQEQPHGTGEMKTAAGIVSSGTWVDGWITEGTWTDTLADDKAAVNGINIWKTFTGTYQNGTPYNGTATFTDGTTTTVIDGIRAVMEQLHDDDNDEVYDGGAHGGVWDTVS
jgi:hypothetical protein